MSSAVLERSHQIHIDHLNVSAYRIPTDKPESDGTLAWRDTTMVLVQAFADGVTGLGYTYADTSTAHFIDAHLKEIVMGAEVMDVPKTWTAMVHGIRNLGRPGVTSMAIAAVDTALWDLKAKILNLPLVTLLGAVRQSIPVYGSGGFTSYTTAQLQQQLAAWVSQGMRWVKMKVGTRPMDDVARVRAAREAIGRKPGLFVDANAAYSRTESLAFANSFRESGVSWFEEPVNSDDLEGLRFIRDRAPAGMDITAGEYGYEAVYFRRMLEAKAVDVLQADVTRCAGITEFMRVAALCSAAFIPLSSHCAPALHCHVACAVPAMRHIEYFHDHARIENNLFDGAPVPINGLLAPDLSKAGMGLSLIKSEAAAYAIYGNP